MRSAVKCAVWACSTASGSALRCGAALAQRTARLAACVDEPTAAAVDATHLTQRTTAREQPTPAAGGRPYSDCEQSVGWSPWLRWVNATATSNVATRRPTSTAASPCGANEKKFPKDPNGTSVSANAEQNRRSLRMQRATHGATSTLHDACRAPPVERRGKAFDANAEVRLQQIHRSRRCC